MSRIRVNSIKPISGQIVSLSGSLIVTGDVTAEQFITEKVQTSIIYRSGSTLFGDSADDIHNFTGSIFVSGGLDSNKSITLGDDINLQKGVNGGGLLEVLPTDTEGLHGIQLAAETTSSNVNYTTFYNNKFSIAEAGRSAAGGSNGERIKIEDYTKAEGGVTTRYAGMHINHPVDSRFKLGADISAEADYPFYVNADSKFNGDVIVTGTITAEQFNTTIVSSSVLFQSGSTKFGDTSDDTHDFTGSVYINGDLTVAETGILSILGYSNVSESLARLDHFSSSLDDYYATDAQLDSVSSSLAIETAHLLNFSSSLDNYYATDAQLDSVSSSLAIETAHLLNFSSSLDNYYATDAQLDSVSSSLAVETAHLLNFSSSFDNIYASEAELYTATASLDARIISLESFSSSIDSEYATDVQLNVVSASFAATTSGSIDDIAILQTDVGNNNDDIAALSGSQLGLLAATASYAFKSDITGSFTLLSASIAQSWTENHNDIHDLEQDAYTFVPSASIELNYVSKAKLRAALTGSTNYNEFTGSLLALLA